MIRLISIFILLNNFFIAGSLKAETINLERPPESLAQWYKPDNKRQVWLHTMFKLRREMQALREYAEQEDASSMKSWISDFSKHYTNIPIMVPEWKDKIKPQLIDTLKKHTENKDFYKVALTLNKINDTCDSCHNDYQAQVTILYRSPNFENIKINDTDDNPQNIENNMQDLSMYVNQVLIALKDGDNNRALLASKKLDIQLNNMVSSCTSCHQDDLYPIQRILGETTKNNLNKLQSHISNNQIKESQELMGTIAVTVCSRCHNTHRVVYDIRSRLQSKKH